MRNIQLPFPERRYLDMPTGRLFTIRNIDLTTRLCDGLKTTGTVIFTRNGMVEIPIQFCMVSIQREIAGYLV